MLKKSLCNKLFEAFSIQRWNERIRPVELVEMDKTAHKMILAWCLARAEEDAGREVDWNGLVMGGVFELMRRTVISDIKSPILDKVRTDHPETYRELNRWVLGQMDEHLEDEALRRDFEHYLLGDDLLDPQTRRVLDAAHLTATYLEFQIVRAANPGGYQIDSIQRDLLGRLEPYLDLPGVRLILTRQNLADFVELCGQLRFQIRWGQTPRIPRTSVLGHSMLVACFALLLLRELSPCPRRVRNTFFGALFHDLPEAVTRDIISPVKRSVKELESIIGHIEQELAEKEILQLLPEGWRGEISYFTRDEFSGKVLVDGEIRTASSEEIGKRYNEDRFEPLDGEVIHAADQLAAYLEAYNSRAHGITSASIVQGLGIRERQKNVSIGPVKLSRIYADFS